MHEHHEHKPPTDRILEEILHVLREIRRELAHPHHIPATYQVTQEPDMAITGIIPGSTGTFVATPLDSNGNPITAPLSVVPIWTSSDPLAVLTPSADGLSVSAAVSTSAVQGGSFVLTIANPDGSASVATMVPYDNVTPPANVAASFSVNQTS